MHPTRENPPTGQGRSSSLDHEGDRLDELADDLVDWAIEAEVETAHEATDEAAERGLIRRMGRVGLGGFLVIIGCFLLVLPGPGLLIIAAGLGLMARDVPFARRWLRIVRARLPETDEGEVAVWVVAGSAGLAIVSITASLWWWLIR
jgi:Putative transmembrane protein (PGPGW)